MFVLQYTYRYFCFLNVVPENERYGKLFPCKFLLETIVHLWTISGKGIISKFGCQTVKYFIGSQVNLKVLVSQYIPKMALNTVSTYMVRVCHPYDTI